MDTGLLGTYINQLSTTVLSLYNVMSGGAFAQATIFALGVQPYINSSIIIQLLTIAIPSLGRMAQEGGEEGKRRSSPSPGMPPWPSPSSRVSATSS